MDDLSNIKKLIVDLEDDEIQTAIKKALINHSPSKILNVLSAGMLDVCKLYEEQEYYLPELL